MQWSFGPDSCPFTSQGGAFWFAWRAPWWVSLVVTGVIFLDASMRTLPCYSLAVQMGSDFKHREWACSPVAGAQQLPSLQSLLLTWRCP